MQTNRSCRHLPIRSRQTPAALLLSLCLLGGLGACSTPPKVDLYQGLGGEVGINHVVSRTLDRSAKDVRTRRSFEGIKLASIKASLSQQICALSGGPCVYEGETMVRTHQDLKIKSSEFDTLVAFLREELDAAGVTASAKNELLRRLAPMKRDIVTAD